MGCFTVLKNKKKKKSGHFVNKKPIISQENMATSLPEPESRGPSLQSAPPSFRNRTELAQSASRVANSRARALSAPCSLVVVDHDAFSSIELDDQEEFKGRGGSVKEQRFSNPLPLPLPSPQATSGLKNRGSFKLSNVSGPILTSGPLPLPPSAGGGLRNFSFEEISLACQQFSVDRCVSEGISSTVYKASFGDDTTGFKRIEATVTRLLPSSQGLKEFLNEVNTLATLQHPQLCKLLGFHAREGSDERMLVYERLYYGSLDRLLYGRSDGPSIDWSTRMKVALCAAQGLAFLHEEGPFQAMYNEFSTSNIQVDKDFSAKLSGYGCVSSSSEIEITNATAATANLSVETLEKGLLTPKSNVWSFGIVLLELLTGRKNLDARYQKEERNIIKWSRPFLTDDCRLSLIIDPRIKGRFPPKAARTVADIALKCLQKDPSERPTMRAIMESLKNVQDMKYPCRYPLQEPSAVAGKQMLKSPSLNGITIPPPQSNFSPSPPSGFQTSSSPRTSMSMPLPPRTCSLTISLEESRINAVRKSPSPVLLRRPGVEGF
ncbi:probable serine/threonine-protein kinase PBL1 [Elaeis guineensis]|uniref:Probable serine/threonine-protein kinase PBL1 n=1 Tax=Elaeis guineensis var. tenera TaxID=51953 RepID=A0A6I9R9V1_ELAGV|nr:probable serine/threonine-protein kinase PBL1 [Elaeis guineensis]